MLQQLHDFVYYSMHASAQAVLCTSHIARVTTSAAVTTCCYCCCSSSLIATLVLLPAAPLYIHGDAATKQQLISQLLLLPVPQAAEKAQLILEEAQTRGFLLPGMGQRVLVSDAPRTV
jgi:hypothetical protein